MGNYVKFSMGKAALLLKVRLAIVYDAAGRPLEGDHPPFQDAVKEYKGTTLPTSLGDVYEESSLKKALGESRELRHLVAAMVMSAGRLAGVRIIEPTYKAHLYDELAELFPPPIREELVTLETLEWVVLPGDRLAREFIPVLDEIAAQVAGEKSKSSKLVIYLKAPGFDEYVTELHEFMAESTSRGFKDFLAIIF